MSKENSVFAALDAMEQQIRDLRRRWCQEHVDQQVSWAGNPSMARPDGIWTPVGELKFGPMIEIGAECHRLGIRLDKVPRALRCYAAFERMLRASSAFAESADHD